ncbi:MAG: hypothetical protein WCO67_07105 [Betaproteobacteria bacterium]
MRKVQPVLIALMSAGVAFAAHAQAPAKGDASKAPKAATAAPKPFTGKKHMEEGEQRGAPKEEKKGKKG